MIDFSIILAGFGGQGILSAGKIIAESALMEGREVSWFPSYGPEMRGGTANCTIITSRAKVCSPIVDKLCNLLIVLNQPSMEMFLPELKQNGVLLYDSSTITPPKCGDDKIIYAVKASDIAKKIGSLKCANSVILGALSVVMKDYFLEGKDKKDFDRAFEEAIMDCFADKQNVIQMNIDAFYAGKEAVEATLTNPHKT